MTPAALPVARLARCAALGLSLLVLGGAAAFVLLFVPATVCAESRDCVAIVRERTGATNAEEVCARVVDASLRAAPGGANFAAAIEIRAQDLGDGTSAWVFEKRAADDAYAYQPSFHFVADAGRLVLVFDGEGVPARYATDRPRVNGRWQIERVQRADIPGVYEKRQVETWFWTGDRYARAFTRTTIRGAADASLNGTTTTWNPELEDAYRRAGVSWTHVVAAGETLSDVARRRGVSVAELVRQNDLRSAHALRVGQKLTYDSWKTAAP